jgi:hypothetical protein
MNAIYAPAGRAAEYSPLAVNLFTGCAHRCKYCYCPAIRHQTLDQWAANPQPRPGILDALRKDAATTSPPTERCSSHENPPPAVHTTATGTAGPTAAAPRLLPVKYRLFLPATGESYAILATADGLADLTALPPYLDSGQTAIIERHLPGRGWEPIAALTGPTCWAGVRQASPPPRSP